MPRNFVLKFVLQFVLMLAFAAAAGALCMVSASAQSADGGQASQPVLGIPLKAPDKPLTEEEIERQKANERAYRAAMQKIPDKKTSADPWGEIRPGAAKAPKAGQ